MKQSEKKQRLKVFQERLDLLREERNLNNTDFAKYLEMSRQTIGFYLNGDRVPDALNLIKIAQKCGVSADWLLGLTDTRSQDTDIRGICETLRLSEKAVGAIINMGAPDPLGGDPAALYALNCMLEACDISGGRVGPGLVIPCIAEYINFSDGQISVSAENGANISPEMLLALTSNAIKRQILEEIGRKLDELKDIYYQ